MIYLMNKFIIKFFSLLNYFLSILLLLLRIWIFFISILNSNKWELIMEWEVIRINSCNIHLIFIFDLLSFYFISLVRLISGRVILFSTAYIIKEKFFSRFILLVFLFIISIYLLILRPNFIRLLLGWDGLGITSYLLVIYYQRNKSYNAGILTALTNRIGDVGLLISISLIIFFGSWRYIYINSISIIFSKIIIYLIIISACTKSAQIPFSAWLPAAIAAPTPVSALVHSSTLVTAGIYLLIRINLIIIEININYVLLILGIITIIMSGITAIIEIDIKKIIALSTLRQLGIIIIVLGLGNPILSFFHLISHAFFKAILFICAGIIIHNIKDYQDIRKIGFRYNNLNYSISIMIIANLSLCGLPFLRGFYSKDLIIEIIIIKGKNLIVFILLILGTILTVLYSCRLNLLISINYLKIERYYFISEFSLFILMRIFILLPFSIIGGIIISFNILRSNKIIFIPFWIKIFLIILISLSIIYFFITFTKTINLKKSIFLWFFSNIWFLPLSANISINFFFISSSILINKLLEIKWVEIFIYKNLYNFINNNYLNKFIDFVSFIYIFQVIEIFLFYLLIMLIFY